MRKNEYYKIYSTTGGAMRVGKVVEYAETNDGQEFTKKGTRQSQRFPQAVLRIVSGPGCEELKLIHFNGNDIDNMVQYSGPTAQFESMLKSKEDAKAAEKAEKERLKKVEEFKAATQKQSSPASSYGTQRSTSMVESAPAVSPQAQYTLDSLLKSIRIVRPGYPETTLSLEIAQRSVKLNSYNNIKVFASVAKDQRITLSSGESRKSISFSGVVPLTGVKFSVLIVVSLSATPSVTITEG